ncbi:sodium:proton antiporter [Nocardia sp. CDC159]|uniref:Sodium:proton antiporter n=1 Tax=Nocardia pulmonis TaxID=2951408 RepID=A0A9X2E643_9NOCA|nr:MULTISPECIES: sodium:proton antiporter [Nocardia]MCM6774350.1 sodium:proton antiporter [Nocardia pulmonis]MCM6787584.1 sodium:proton antiporter [Nocardia sp. CDC159]
MEKLVVVFVLLFATILAQPLARRTGLAPAVLMTLFGCLLAVAPFVPSTHIDPNLILPLVLPPLLYASARRTSWRRFAADRGTLATTAVGLVAATAVAVAALVWAWHPALPFAAALVLGALVAPPDPVAVSAMAGRLGLPRRLVSALEGEGLFNDVTAAVLYTVAVQVVVTGHFSGWGALWDFAVSAVVAVAVGLGLGWCGSLLTRRLAEASWQVALGLLLPFAAYGLAAAWGGSAVLATLLCSLYLSEAALGSCGSAYRSMGDAFWEITEMLVTGLAFGLIGLELRSAARAVGHEWPTMLGVAAATIAVVVALRLGWLSTTWAMLHGRWRRRAADEPYTWRETVVTWWAGQRGVATVALALAIPFTTDSGAPFPGRGEILFIAFAVVLFTLLLQGPTLPAMVRATGVRADPEADREFEYRLWQRIREAQLGRLEQLAAAERLPEHLVDGLRDGFTARPTFADTGPHAAIGTGRTLRVTQRIRRIAADIHAVGRREALTARREPHAPTEVVDRVIRRLDLRGPGDAD